MSATPLAVQSSNTTTRESHKAGYFFGPLVDFTFLGGGSIALIIALSLSNLGDEARNNLAAISLFLANIINHPHFAHSYQIFYRGYARKAFGSGEDATLRFRYVFAGLVAPLALVVFFAGSIAAQNPRMLGIAANVMALLVGWHYAKQGYGMLIAASVLKRQFFSGSEKTLLLTNAHACWISFWLGINWLADEKDLWGIKHWSVGIPTILVALGVCLAVVTTCLTAIMLTKKWAASKALPLNGVLAYCTTLYLWLLLLNDPIFVLVIPACHSLQYLLVVWRYRLNVESAGNARTGWKAARPSLRLAAFAVVGFVLGYCGFWAVPELLNAMVPYDRDLFGPTLFLFVFWVFINVHHYLIDNVIWRRENPETKKYLFGG